MWKLTTHDSEINFADLWWSQVKSPILKNVYATQVMYDFAAVHTDSGTIVNGYSGEYIIRIGDDVNNCKVVVSPPKRFDAEIQRLEAIRVTLMV